MSQKTSRSSMRQSSITSRLGSISSTVNAQQLIPTMTESLKVVHTERKDVRKLQKPWEKRKTAANLRIRLHKVHEITDDEDIEFIPDIPHRVLIRLGRAMGKETVRLIDRDYMATLSKRVKEEEERSTRARYHTRVLEGDEFFKKLALDGALEPEPGMEHLRNHPLYRTNRIMKRLAEMRSRYVPRNSNTKNIQVVEPFDEYEHKGILFGKHANHFQKTGRLTRQKDTERRHSSSESRRESLPAPEPLPVFPSSDHESEWGGEEYSAPESLISSPRKEDSENPFDNFRHHLSRGTLSLATRFLGLSDVDLEKRYRVQRSKLVEDFYENTKEADAENTLNAGRAVYLTGKRGEMKAEEFCNKVHRKLFTN